MFAEKTLAIISKRVYTKNIFPEFLGYRFFIFSKTMEDFLCLKQDFMKKM